MFGIETAQKSFLGRLAKDRGGNTIAMMAAALIPMAGMVGGGIDLARMYITKTRMQHACDAGALAGRKAMGGGQWSQDNGKPNTIARNFFNANYKVGSFGSSGLTYAYSESAGKVTGTATAQLPMTLTRVIGRTTEQLNVTCEAEMRLPNTDVMFVLDNTGSMASKAKSTDTQTKMEALKSAVKCFYEILARLDTSEVCTGDAPSGGTSSEVQIRFGFVPYDTNVNIGRLLPSNWFVDKWTYQSRVLTPISGVPTAYFDASGVPDFGAYSTDKTMTAQNDAECQKLADDSPVASYGSWSTPVDGSDGYEASTGTTSGPGVQTGSGSWLEKRTVTEVKNKYVKFSGKTCTYTQAKRSWTRTYVFKQTANGATDSVGFNAWTYKPVVYDTSQLKDGNGWKADYKYPMPNISGGITQNVWDGCIEERDTVRANSYSPRPSDAYDLDIDSAPTSDPATQWRPALNKVVFPRMQSFVNAGSDVTKWSKDEIKTVNTFTGASYSCVVQAQPLTTYPSASTFENYVDSMQPKSNTYHDIGMLWGARLLSPTGMWRATNEFTPTGGAIQRHLIFMTDGDACTENYNYQAYGLAWYDRRQTDPNQVPTDGCSTGSTVGTLTAQVQARTAALCSAVKNMKDTTLWVIWFGVSQPKIEGDMKACASPDRFFAARDAASLQATFRQIANQISQLRVTN